MSELHPQSELFRGLITHDLQTGHLVCASTGARVQSLLTSQEIERISQRVSAAEPFISDDTLSRVPNQPVVLHALNGALNKTGPFLRMMEKGLTEEGDDYLMMHSINYIGALMRLTHAAAEARPVEAYEMEFLLSSIDPLHLPVTGPDGRPVELAGDLDSELAFHLFECVINASYWNARSIVVTQGELAVSTDGLDRPGSEYRYKTYSITDNGDGMLPEQIPANVQAGYTRRKTGTGSGLAFLRQYALDHGGILRISSRHKSQPVSDPRTVYTMSTYVPVSKGYEPSSTHGTEVTIALPVE
ncbi:MAG: sensor protein ZraS [candidate division WS6 bacterium OLB20]|uniref:Sensor protein ZraS n=1 Tax=candidate division WS6 bacterium OLB20 TaxID=1617426 RepID=A0A136LZ14_9BACT|nr:MAG: sensor protein ZraS [candidate division WS6 bacterium OLB20]